MAILSGEGSADFLQLILRIPVLEGAILELDGIDTQLVRVRTRPNSSLYPLSCFHEGCQIKHLDFFPKGLRVRNVTPMTLADSETGAQCPQDPRPPKTGCYLLLDSSARSALRVSGSILLNCSLSFSCGGLAGVREPGFHFATSSATSAGFLFFARAPRITP